MSVPPLNQFSAKAPPSGPFVTPTTLPNTALNLLSVPEMQRAQWMEFSQRLRAFGLPYASMTSPSPLPLPGALLPVDPRLYLDERHMRRFSFFHEEPKPSQSYIGLIAMGILSAKDKKLVLSDIYQWILDNYPYFRTRGPGWRNSIRHNLSLNDCFVKAGRAANGKGHYWAIHPAVVADFERGDFRRRRAQTKVRKAMGLTVQNEEEDTSSPPPPCSADVIEWRARMAMASRTQAKQTINEPMDELAAAEDDSASSVLEKPAAANKSPAKLHEDATSPNLVLPISSEQQLPFRPLPTLPLGYLPSLAWKNCYSPALFPPRFLPGQLPTGVYHHQQESASPLKAKKGFDIASLLAPDTSRMTVKADVTLNEVKESVSMKERANDEIITCSPAVANTTKSRRYSDDLTSERDRYEIYSSRLDVECFQDDDDARSDSDVDVDEKTCDNDINTDIQVEVKL